MCTPEYHLKDDCNEKKKFACAALALALAISNSTPALATTDSIICSKLEESSQNSTAGYTQTVSTDLLETNSEDDKDMIQQYLTIDLAELMDQYHEFTSINPLYGRFF